MLRSLLATTLVGASLFSSSESLISRLHELLRSFLEVGSGSFIHLGFMFAKSATRQFLALRRTLSPVSGFLLRWDGQRRPFDGDTWQIVTERHPTPSFTVKLAVRTEGKTMHEKSRCVAMQGTTMSPTGVCEDG